MNCGVGGCRLVGAYPEHKCVMPYQCLGLIRGRDEISDVGMILLYHLSQLRHDDLGG